MKCQTRNPINNENQRTTKCKFVYLTCESRASKTSVGIGSGQNSSGTKLSRIFLISDALNIGHTFTNKDERMNKEKKCMAS